MAEYNFDKKLTGGPWTVEVDTSANYGYFEHERTGGGGGLWFQPSDTRPGQLELSDYDGVACLPATVAILLRNANFVVGPEFD